ncbi:hypothetical protein [Streptomyces puniciscabiei]|uniref:hypothetical protein n=1 Tax=Streptomyces puniciscabiei TaxID=164348 RepID=UPI000A83D203|nr:hypothetical protein [Streptomyces puniciscabiei]
METAPLDDRDPLAGCTSPTYRFRTKIGITIVEQYPARSRSHPRAHHAPDRQPRHVHHRTRFAVRVVIRGARPALRVTSLPPERWSDSAGDLVAQAMNLGY